MIPDMLAVHTYMAFANYWIACILPLWCLDPTKPAGGECLAYRACQLSVVFFGKLQRFIVENHPKLGY
jgi:hypothetical protein